MLALMANTPLISHSTPKLGPPTVPGGDPQSPLCRAFERFCSTVNQAEKAAFSGLTLSDVFARLEHLDRVHFSSSKVRRLIARLEPFLYFLDRHAKALDSMVQVYPNPSALIWGSLRVILEVRHGPSYDCLPVLTLDAQSTLSFSQYFKNLADMMERLGSSVSVYQEYEKLLSTEQHFQEALADVYFETMVFLKKAKAVFSRKGYLTSPLIIQILCSFISSAPSILLKSLWRNFDSDFQVTIGVIARKSTQLDSGICLAYRSLMCRKLEEQAKQQRLTHSLLCEQEVKSLKICL